jgi:Glycosyl hydrolases family 35
VQRAGEPALELDGKPFFFWGAAFFYERLPASEWRASMLELRKLGANTLDLYVPWNWHELADGEFDFDGHTNPRRNLREVLRLGKELGFTFVVRPGPVIRNEWRNGGYPAWLLTRPEYGMPLHDVLEGRYPATATLQNAHGDDAAAEWMRNPTHLRYASRWLHRALDEFRPVADRVLAVQLDDDQGAYADNQTYPAPNLERYLRWLEAQVRDVAGPVTPVFINTYEMRVPASSPVWTMGNWYQSEAYTIGDHDRVALDLATAMLRTNRRGPLAMSEFQAGWLAQPEDPQPRPADPSNTQLALFELLAWGAHGVIDFPMQDTLAPFGWEAPFSNALYAWDAALRYPWHPLTTSPPVSPDVAPWAWIGSRYGETGRFGRTVRTFGPLLAESRRVADVALAYPLSSYPGDAAAGSAALARFREHLRECAARGTPCEPVDLAYASAARLREFRMLLVDDVPTRRARAALLAEYIRRGGTVGTSVPAEHQPGVLLQGPDGTFLVAVNWTGTAQRVTAQPRIGSAPIHLGAFTVRPKSGRLVALDVRLRRLDARYPADARISTTCELSTGEDGVIVEEEYADDACVVGGRAAGRPFSSELRGHRSVRVGTDGTLHPLVPALNANDMIAYEGGANNVLLSATSMVSLAGMHASPGGAETYRADAFADGSSAVVLQTESVRAVIVPDGGGRVPVFGLYPSPRDEIAGTMDNVFDATGALRDDALVQPPPSATDRIAKYTHSYPAGTFNRPYAVSDANGGSVHLSADVPDVVPNGARIERVVSLLPDTARLVVDERATFNPGPGAERQRAVVLSALSMRLDADGKPVAKVYADGAAEATAGALDAPRGVFVLRPLSSPGGWLVLAVSWRPGDIESAAWEPHRSNGTLRMVLAPGWRRVTYALLARARTREAALAFVEAERGWVAANPAPARR